MHIIEFVEILSFFSFTMYCIILVRIGWVFFWLLFISTLGFEKEGEGTAIQGGRFEKKRTGIQWDFQFLHHLTMNVRKLTWFFFINYLSKCRTWDGKKKLLHEVNYIPVHIFVENDSVVYLAIYPFYIQLFTLLLLLNSSNGHLHFVLQPELFSRKRIGRHFFQLSTTTLLLKFRFIFKNCNVLHLLHC